MDEFDDLSEAGRSAQFRALAAEARQMATSMRDIYLKDLYLLIAEKWEEMAAKIEL